MANVTITVGRAARRTGLTEKAIRLYESRGLLETAERTEAGYRTYSDEDIDVLRFIRQAKALGLRLEEIKDIIDLQRQGAQPCQKVLQLVDSHIGEIDRTIADLKALRQTLVKAQRAAEESSKNGEGAVVCRIIESLRPDSEPRTKTSPTIPNEVLRSRQNRNPSRQLRTVLDAPYFVKVYQTGEGGAKS